MHTGGRARAGDSPPERGARVRFPPPLAFLGAVVAGALLSRLVMPAPVPVVAPALRVAVGALFVVLGVCLVASARVLFVRTGQSPLPWKPTPELIFRGPYRFTRNPMYVGITLIVVGIGGLSDNLWIVGLSPIALAIVHVIAVLPEERYLLEKFGESYGDYLRRVRRYL